MNGSKDNPGGGGARGASNGLRGGKRKQVARGCNDRAIKSSEPDPSRGAHDKPTVWRHGKYVIVRPPKGPGLASRRAGTSSRSRVYDGDQRASLARPLDITPTLRDMSKDIIEDDNDDFNEDFDDGDNSDDGDNNGGDASDEDGRDLIDRQGNIIMAHNEGGDGRGRGGGPANRREIMARSSTKGCGGRDGGRGSKQVNGHGSTDYSEQPTTEAYQPVHEPSDDEDEPIAIGRGAVVPPPIPTPENRIWIWVENDEFNIQNPVSRTIGSILKLMWSGGWIGWKDVPVFHRDRMFERFQKYYQWEDEEKHSIYSCWERCIKGKFPNLLGKARKFAKTCALKKGIEVGKDWSVTIPFKPQWISQDSWKQLVKVWSTGSWQDKSSQNIKNREKASGGRHTVGSKSFITVRKEMDHTFKRRAKFGEFWLQTHAKKGSRPLDKLPVCSELADVDLLEVDDVEDINQEINVDWVDTRAGEAYESYMKLIVKKYGDDTSLHPEFDMELWSSVAGGTKKRRLYGTSNITDPYVVLTGAPAKPDTNSFPSARSNKVQQLEEKIAELEREKVAELERGKVEKQAMLEKIEENARLFAEMNEKLQLLSRKQQQSLLST